MKTKSPIKNYCFTVRATDFVKYEDERISIVPISSDQLRNFLTEHCSEFAYQLEITQVESESDGVQISKENPHFQGRCRLKVKKRKSTLLNLFREFFSENIIDKRIKHDAIVSLVSFSPEHHRDASEFYCLKTDHTSIEGTQVRFPELVPEYDGADLFFGDDPSLKDWRQQIRDVCNHVIAGTEPADNTFLRNGWRRTILVIQDIEGCQGKSIFAKTLCFENPDDTVYLPVVDKPGQIMGALANHKTPLKRIFFDIPRDLPYDEVRKIFMLAELVKLGMFTTSYYASLKTKLQAPPAVVIFTNREFFVHEIRTWAPLNRYEFYNIDEGDKLLTPKLQFPYKSTVPD